ncbi:MAG: dihydrolipoamide acetyltransferase family protein [Candidatus Aminicenantes bacterium]|nr:dihydrolipoamide acetyltransferase family protein [Candidatus Aminicenantes bacterium]
MAKEFRFPDVGEGITEGEVVRWLVKEGDEVAVDQTLAEIETDKAVVEMPSPYAGTVLKLHFKEKDLIKVGQPLVTIGEKGEVPAEAAPATQALPLVPAPAGPGATPGPAAVPGPAGGVLATPKVRALAKELGVEIGAVRGAGPGGRVTEDDVRSFQPALAERKPGPKIKAKYDLYGTLERIPLRGVRRATAKKMRESLDHAAHVTHCDEADAGPLEALRQKMKAEVEAGGAKLTYLPFVVKALIEALKLHPTLNATLDEDESEIVVRKYYNIGIAVDVPDGLIVPVVKAAGQKSVAGLAAEIQALAMSARERTLDLADLKGGTFSITNVGVIGGDFATPIINYPEAAILATMKIADRARVVDGKVVVKRILPLCLSFDHRVVDGAEAARFIRDLIRFLEAPEKLPLGGD